MSDPAKASVTATITYLRHGDAPPKIERPCKASGIGPHATQANRPAHQRIQWISGKGRLVPASIGDGSAPRRRTTHACPTRRRKLQACGVPVARRGVRRACAGAAPAGTIAAPWTRVHDGNGHGCREGRGHPEWFGVHAPGVGADA